MHVVNAEKLQHLVNAENFLVAVRPAEAHQIVQDCRRQIAFATVIEDVGRAVPLRQALAVVAENHRYVRKFRHVVTQRAVEVNLLRRVADVVFAADDQRHFRCGVIDDHAEIVSRRAVGAANDPVIQLAVIDRHYAAHLVVPTDASFQRVFETHRRRHARHRFAALTVLAVVTLWQAEALLLLAHRLQLLRRAPAVVRLPARNHLLDNCVVVGEALALIDDFAVMMQTEPVQAVENHLGGRLSRALQIRILNAQAEHALMLARVQPTIQRGTHPADVQIAGRAGGKTGNNHKNLYNNKQKQRATRQIRRHFTA